MRNWHPAIKIGQRVGGFHRRAIIISNLLAVGVPITRHMDNLADLTFGRDLLKRHAGFARLWTLWTAPIAQNFPADHTV